MDRTDFLLRSRRAARTLIAVSDGVNGLVAEATLTNAFAPPEEGGLKPEDFSGQFADLAAEDVAAFYAVLQQIFGNLTPEQKRVFYKMKDAGNGLMSLNAPLF